MSKKRKNGSVVAPDSQKDLVQLTTKNRWQFRCRISERSHCMIKPWLAKLSIKGQASLDRSIEHLADQPQQSWARPHACTIGDNIYVIHCHDENRTQHRVFGHFHPSDHSAVLTLTGYEKDDTYYPKNYVKTTAAQRDDCNGDHSGTTIRCRYADAAIGATLEELDDYHIECQLCSECTDIHSSGA